MGQSLEPRGTIGVSTHLLLFDLTVATRASLPFQSLDPPLECVAERASVCDEVFQFRRVSLTGDFVGSVD